MYKLIKEQFIAYQLANSISFPWYLDPPNLLWNLYFDGAINKLWAGVGVKISSAIERIGRMFFTMKLGFEAFNNVAEYEALVLGLSTS